MVEKLRQKDFESHLNERFTVHCGAMKPTEIELVEVFGRNASNIESFSLLFRNTEGKVFCHNTYPVTHPKMGDFQLFLGPVETNRTDGVYYEAVFNYFKNS
jgi:hypothetical protein